MDEKALQHKLAAMFAANKDDVSVPKIYIDMTGEWETAAVIDEIMFWTLPKKATGRTSLRVFRENKLWLAVRRAEWWDRKRLGTRQADLAIKKLKEMGFIESDVFLFDGKPTVHLRLILDKFIKVYSEKLMEYAKDDGDESLMSDISDLYEMMSPIHQTVKSNSPNGEMLNSPNGEIINSPIQPEITTSYAMPKTDETKAGYKTSPDLLDGVMKYETKPQMIKNAMHEHFRLNVKGGNKFEREWLEWAVAENITAEQIKGAADLWKNDKRFNWQVPTLKAIYEKWPMLVTKEPQERKYKPL